MPLEDISLNLIDVCDSVIKSTLSTKRVVSNEYNKNGRKYKRTQEGNFIRVRGESKHLIVAHNYSNYGENYAIVSSYYILQQTGTILQDYRDLCLAIIFTSREIELNKWYESNSKVCSVEDALYNPFNFKQDAMDYISGISLQQRIEYVKAGCSILAATKINFLQTDHHVASPMLEGYVLKELINEICGSESALKSEDVYNSLRAFCHWCSIRGVLHCLDVPGLRLDAELIHNFKNFPRQPEWIKNAVMLRYPAGTSKCALIKKSLIVISKSVFGKLITCSNPSSIHNLFKLCSAIEAEPLRYHIRASSNNLSEAGHVDISDVFHDSESLISFISSVYHGSNGGLGNSVFTSAKFNKAPAVRGQPAYKQANKISTKISKLIKAKGGKLTDDEIVEFLGGEVPNSVFSVVSECFNLK